MSFPRVSCLLLSICLIPLAPSTGLPEQPEFRPSVQKSPPSRLISPRPFTVNRETMDQLAKTPLNAPSGLTGQERQALRDMAGQIKAHDTRSAMNGWSTLVGTLHRKNTPADINALIQYVLRESYLQSGEDLKRYADQVKSINARKKQAREEIANLRDRIARECAGKPKSPSGKPARPPDPDAVKCASLNKSLRESEERASRLNDDDQLANVDLQNALQRQRKTLQMISDMSKKMYDTATAIIRKSGG